MVPRPLRHKAAATCPNGQRLPPRAKTFPLQNQLIFETIPLTAEAPVSRPWWLGYPDCPCTTLVTSARSATRYWVPGRRSRQVKKLYIGNLPFSATEDQLYTLSLHDALPISSSGCTACALAMATRC